MPGSKYSRRRGKKPQKNLEERVMRLGLIALACLGVISLVWPHAVEVVQMIWHDCRAAVDALRAAM